MAKFVNRTEGLGVQRPLPLRRRSRVRVFQRVLAVFSVALLSVGLIVVSDNSPAYASAGTGALTIVASGGSAENSGWTYSGGVLTTSGGTAVSVNASDVISKLNSGNLTIEARSIAVNADIVATALSGSLTLKAIDDITISNGTEATPRKLTTLGGNIVLWSNVDRSSVTADAQGGVKIGHSVEVRSGGGAIVIGGGVDTSPSNGIPDGPALRYGETTIGNFRGAVDLNGSTTGQGSTIIASSGGNVSIWGESLHDCAYTPGVSWLNSGQIDAGSGSFVMRGMSPANVAANDCTGINLGRQGNVRASVALTAAGGVQMEGRTLSTRPGSRGLQFQEGSITVTGSGAIGLEGSTGSGGGFGVMLGRSWNTGDTTRVDALAATGDISVDGGANGIHLRGVLGAKPGSTVTSSTSDIVLSSDKFFSTVNTGDVTGAMTSGHLTVQSSATTGSVALDTGSFTADVGIYSLGRSGVSSDITIGRTTVAQIFDLYATGEVTQTHSITADEIGLNGPADFTLTNTSNAIGTLAAGSSGAKVATLSLYDASGGLTIGQVGSLQGITATGDVLVETGADDVTLARSIATDSTTSTAITVNAGKSAAAGTSTGGNIVVSGSPTLTAGAGAIVRMFSGNDAASTGLTALVGGSSNVYFGVDETSSLSPTLSAGTKYALYRGKQTPQLSALSDRSVTVGATAVSLADPSATNSANASVSGATTWSSSNTSVASLSGSTLTFGSVGSAVVTATFTPTDTTAYQTATTTFTVTVSAAGGGGSSSGSSSAGPTTVIPSAPSIAPRPTRLAPVVPNTSPVPRPVERLGLVFDPDASSRATIGGALSNLVKTPVGSSELSLVAGAFQFGLSLNGAQGAEVKTDTPSQSPEMFVPRGQSAAVSGSGSYPGSFVQLWLPNGSSSRELARIPVRSDGTFTSDVSFAAGALEMPVPIGRQVLQVVGYDERGNQTVVDMTINIGQGAPAPEPNRQVGELPALTAGQSLGTSGGMPETVSVTGIPDSGSVVVEGGGWAVSVIADRDNGVVENADGNVLVRLDQSSTGSASGSGFLPGTLATVWLFSEPTLMATVTVDENGEFTSEFLVDARLIAPGEHTLQIQGVGTDGYIKAANLGVVVEQPGELTTESASGLLWWVLGIFALALVLVFLLIARRRRHQNA